MNAQRYPRREPPRLEPANITGRVLPHNLDAEAAVLSAMMIDPAAVDPVVALLKPEHFFSDANGAVFESCAALAEANHPVDLVSVVNHLGSNEKIAAVGGKAYVVQLVDATPAVRNVASHALIVFEKWRQRRIIAVCQHTAANGYDDVGIVGDFIAEHEASVVALSQTAKQTAMVPVNDAIGIAFKAITAAAERGSRITGTSTGYEKFDAKTAGLHAGDLTIIAARPGMGKTSFVMNLAVNVASPHEETVDSGAVLKHTGHGVAVFSLEMPVEQLATRMVCSEGQVDLGKLRSGYLQDNDWSRLTEAAQYLSSLPIWIDDTPAISLSELRAKVRRIQADYNRPATATTPERKMGLVVIDYLQLMKGRDGVNSREQEISEISRGLKGLAKELKVPVIALSQLNRSVETRSTKDKRPQLSDLRESGAIEQDADMIVFIYRDEYYNPETTNAKGIAELIIAKQRNGPTGKVMVKFTSAFTRFDNLAAADYPKDDA